MDYVSANVFRQDVITDAVSFTSVEALWFSSKCLDLNSYICVAFFGREYHDFLLCFDARTALPLFTANDPCQLPSVNFDTSQTALNHHAQVRIRPIVRRIQNPQETRLSETLTYVLATLQDIRTSFCALIRRRTIFTSAWCDRNAG